MKELGNLGFCLMSAGQGQSCIWVICQI